MARNDLGKWVARAGATGGGRTYRGKTPVNWYATLILILVLGIASVLYSAYEYRHPKSNSAQTSTTTPKTSTTWHAGLVYDVCGTIETPLAATPSTSAKTQSFIATGNGVITINPKSNSDAGKNATLSKFISGYKGLALTATSFTVPIKGKSATFKNGQACAKGTPDAGKTGKVQVAQWPSVLTNKTKGTAVTGNPGSLRFANNQGITIGFLPSGTSVPKPTGKVVTAVLKAANTPAPSASSSTLPSTTITIPSKTPTSTPSTPPTT